MSGLRLLAVHAHPDDESTKGAATMARYVAEGHRVMVVTLTGGERGDILNPALDNAQARENIRHIRRQEMAKAAQILGIEHQWLGYIDSGFPSDPTAALPDDCFAKVDLNQASEKLVRVIRQFRPHVLVTYDEHGGYPHPDHIRCHQVSVAAYHAAGDPYAFPEAGPAWKILKLYYDHGFIAQRFELFEQEFTKHGRTGPFQPLLEWLPTHILTQRVTTQVHCSDYFPQRQEALRAHASQIDPQGFFLAVPLEWQQRLWPTEEFELVHSRVPTRFPEQDLFAGITHE